MNANQQEEHMKWITREHVKVDRVACPWLISKFVDKNPELRPGMSAYADWKSRP